jgi:hypoxanthine phosphoribosyltransferase
MKYKNISWKVLDNYISLLADKIKAKLGRVNGIFGLPRGGLVPAVMLSHKLNVPLLLAPCEGCVVVDDIADTGTSLLHYKERGYKIAVIWYKPKSKVKPDFCAVNESRSKMGGAWVVFPWETPISTL